MRPEKQSTVQRQLIYSAPALLWVKVPGERHALDRNAKMRLDCVLGLCNLQTQHKRHVLAEVPKHGATINYLQEHLRVDVVYNTYQVPWCSLGVHHPQSKRPSMERTTVLTTLQLPTFEGCACQQPKSNHLFKRWHMRRGQDRQSYDIMQGMFCDM